MSNPDQTRLRIARRFLTSLEGRAPDPSIGEVLAPDVKFHILGTHRFAGTFVGHEAVVQHVKEFQEWSAGRYQTVKWEDWLIGETHVAALVQAQVGRSGAVFRGRLFFVLEFDPANRIAGMAVFPQDVAAMDRFFPRS